MKVFHLLENREAHFSDAVTPLEAVTQMHCSENGLMSAWLSARHSNFLDFAFTLPVTYGSRSVCCGDWACLEN